jgi:hypothetical protein
VWYVGQSIAKRGECGEKDARVCGRIEAYGIDRIGFRMGTFVDMGMVVRRGVGVGIGVGIGKGMGIDRHRYRRQ